MKTKQLLIQVFIGMLGGLLSLAIYLLFIQKQPHPLIVEQNQPVKFASYSNDATPAAADFTNAANMSVHAVVHVKTQFMQNNYIYNPLYDFFFGQPNYQIQQTPVLSSGSGVIISDDGYIVTNNHVIQNAEKIEITLNDERSFTAKVVGIDPATDIALLKIDAKDLPYLRYGDSDELKIGEWVLAAGNPFNLRSTVTAGIVSAKARNINILSEQFAIESFIQTDAAVNPGNSGGALVNTKGELIGINTAIASKTGSYMGYSFAIPVNIVKKIVADIIEFGEVQRAYLGVSIMNIDSKLLQDKSLDKIEGVYVADVNNKGAANLADIRSGDVILKIGDISVNSISELQEQVSKYRPGDKINVTIKRNNTIKDVQVTLQNKMGNTDIVKTEITSVLGANFEELTNEEKTRLRLSNGVKVKEVGTGKLRAAGIRDGFIITRINRKPVYSPNDIKNILETYQGGVYIEGVYSNGMTAYYAFGL